MPKLLVFQNLRNKTDSKWVRQSPPLERKFFLFHGLALPLSFLKVQGLRRHPQRALAGLQFGQDAAWSRSLRQVRLGYALWGWEWSCQGHNKNGNFVTVACVFFVVEVGSNYSICCKSLHMACHSSAACFLSKSRGDALHWSVPSGHSCNIARSVDLWASSSCWSAAAPTAHPPRTSWQHLRRETAPYVPGPHRSWLENTNGHDKPRAYSGCWA